MRFPTGIAAAAAAAVAAAAGAAKAMVRYGLMKPEAFSAPSSGLRSCCWFLKKWRVDVERLPEIMGGFLHLAIRYGF